MINELQIKNFQSHKDSTLHFDKGVNCIVGQTDSGKSSIIRALKLVVYNEPNGDSYISNWGGPASVSIKVSDLEVIRTKSKSKNEYSLSSIETPFTAFGQTVPEEIKQALNLEGINLQQQLDPHFLLSETSGKVALHFNKIAKLDKIDRAQSNVQKEINAINSEIKHRKKELEIKEDKLKEFTDLDSLEWDLEDLESLEKKRLSKESKAKEITKLGNQINGIEQEIHLAEKEVQAEKSIDVVLGLYDEKAKKQSKLIEFQKVINKISKTLANIESIEKVVKAEASINKVLKLYEKRQKAALSANKIEKLYKTTKKVKERLTSKEIELKELEETYKKEFPEVCPLCNTQIKTYNVLRTKK